MELRRIFRRKKRWQGATWTPESQSSGARDGAFCKVHKTWHGYKTMGIQYEKRGDYFWILWSCPKTGDVIQEMRLGNG